MPIDPDKLFKKFEKERLSESFRAKLFEDNDYVYESGSHLMPKSIVRVSIDGKRELGVFKNGAFSHSSYNM